MNLSDALKMSDAAIAEHLEDTHLWTSVLNSRLRKTCGRCSYRTRQPSGEVIPGGKIELSTAWVKVAQPEEVREVILHEIAHALTAGIPDLHGPRFKATVRRIGGTYTECSIPAGASQVTALYAGVCLTHGVVGRRHRRSKGMVTSYWHCAKTTPRGDRCGEEIEWINTRTKRPLSPYISREVIPAILSHVDEYITR